MLSRFLHSARGDRGFTLIELLVVILIIGILAAIALPSFLSQKSKAYDAGAKELARTAQTTAETYASDHAGSYTGLSTKELHAYEATVPLSKAAANGGAYMKEPESAGVTVPNSEEYTVTAVAANTGTEFTIARNKEGEVTRSCKSAGTKKDCSGSTASSW